jgi:hypothetical protein
MEKLGSWYWGVGPLYILLFSILVPRTKNVGVTQTNEKKKYKPKVVVFNWNDYITNFMGHNLIIIVVQKNKFKGFYGIDMDVIHLFVSFEHRCHVHCLNTTIICLFVLFKHNCMFICGIYT